MNKIIVVVLMSLVSIFAQEKYTINGKILDSENQKILPFANVKVLNKPIGTAADINGEYKFNLKPGSYKLVYSFIGYTSDTVEINLNNNLVIDSKLNHKELQINEVTVTPGVNPAIRIIRKTIEQKLQRASKLESYVFNAYTKGVVRSDKEINGVTGGIEMDLLSGSEESDTVGLKIVGILENESKGFYKTPDYYKDEIIARKQTANFPASLNVITGGRLIQSFYDEELNVTGLNLPSPISDDALDYYYYYIEDSLAYDNKKVYQIYFAPDDANDPGFIGKLYIIDDTFDLAKVDVQINSAANPGGLFKEMKIYQQFLSFDGIFMPVDYRLFGEINFMGLIKMGFEFNSILNRYEINKTIQDKFFDMTLVSVKEGADDKDTNYWQSIQTIPVSTEEKSTYVKMDSLMNVPYNFWDQFSPWSFSYNLGKNYSVTAPLGMYSFNKIEGHSANSEFNFSELLNKRLWGKVAVSYGFDDEKFKAELLGRYLFGRLRTGRIELNIFNKLMDLFGESIEYSNFTSTVLSLVSKQDFRDYYYTKGFIFSIKSEISDYLNLGIGFLNRTDNSAVNNTDFSIFYKDRHYSNNKPIFDTRVNAITASFNLDFRKHIEDGFYKRRTSRGNSLILFNGDMTFASKAFGSKKSFTIYKLNTFAFIKSWGNTYFDINIDAIYANKGVPYQMLYALPGAINNVSQPYTFRTIKIGEVIGDRVVALNVIYDLQDDLFRATGLGFLSSLDLTLSAHFNMAYIDVSESSENLWDNYFIPFKSYKTPLLEAGFSIGQKVSPISLDFTWRLNHRSENGFVFGISTPIL